jgi:hypothetical protein
MFKDNPNGQTQYDPLGLDGLGGSSVRVKDDIVTRLRLDPGNVCGGPPSHPLQLEAADTIEALSKQVEELTAALTESLDIREPATMGSARLLRWMQLEERLTLLSDTTALDERLKQERERIAHLIEMWLDGKFTLETAKDCAAAIRSLT